MVIYNFMRINRKMDITTILMMNTCKWTSFAWCVQDGLTEECKLTDE